MHEDIIGININFVIKLLRENPSQQYGNVSWNPKVWD